MKIVGTCKGELDIKRCYLPGIKIIEPCPSCHALYKWDGDVEYIGYPEVGTPFDFDFYCRECDHEWSKQIQIIIRVVAVEQQQT